MAPPSWVPITKIVPPAVGPEVVISDDRRAWFRDVILRHRLTTLVAQGGSGKSTLVAATVETLDVPVAWVRWHANDDHPSRVIEYLAAALERIDSTLVGTATVLRSSSTALDTDRLVGLLVNDLAAIGPIVLVLDDLHLLQGEAALGVVTALLDLAPADTHVVATARSMPTLPLARLHAAGHWARLYADDLRVEEATAAEVLRRHRITLPPARAVELVSETNGWLVGFLLAARAEANGHPIGTARLAMADYLAEEVLADEPAHFRRFMQETSILEILEPNVCDVVTARVDSAEILTGLRDRLGFLVIEHDGRLRYHDLLRDHVRAEAAVQLDDEHVAELHRRAATLTHGNARIEHLLAAGDYDDAADAIEARSRAWIRHPATDYQMVGWIMRLPSEVRSTHPWLDVALGAASLLGRPSEESVPTLLRVVERSEDEDLELGWLASRLLLVATMDLDRWAPLVDRVHDEELQRLHPALRVESLTAVAWMEHWSGRPDQAFAHASSAIDIVEGTANATAAEGLAMHLAAPLACGPGARERMIRYHQWARERFGPTSRFIDVASRAHLVLLEMLSSGPPAVEEMSQADIDLLDNLPLLALSRLWLGAARAIHAGDAAGVEATLAGPIFGANTVQLLPFSALLSASYRACGRSDDVKRVAALLASAPPPVRSSPIGRSLAAQVEAELAWSTGDHQRAIDVLRDLLAMPDRVVTAPIPDAGCLLAAVLDEAGYTSEAMALLAERVEDLAGRLDSPFRVRQTMPPGSDLLARLAARTPSVALDRVLALDREAGGPSEVPVPGTSEVLTRREVEVLHRLAAGSSNAEIAAELFVSVNTVKTHVSRVITKLGVSSRTAAVARAREYQLI